ncbi:Laccase domain protein yfiH [Kluyvera cryocrescens]|nr:Laccase domain protein yfiH [Kluyvera cryocrescens]
MAKDAKAVDAFRPVGDKYFADIYLLARQRLANMGVTAVFGGDRCTFSEKDDFFSYRRDRTTGRMASFIWLI